MYNTTLQFSKATALTAMLALTALVAWSHVALADTPTLLDPFTQTELDTDWEADRYFPTDGVTSVSAFGRDDVARIGVDSSDTQPGTFQRTEGIKTVGDQNFGTDVQVDLYVDPDWADKAVRAGFWVVGDDGSGTARDNWFGIIEFVNLETSTSGDSATTDHEGWRFWDSTNGWTNVATAFTYGEWVTLRIVLDPDAEEYLFYIDDEMIGSGPAGENFIRELFLNSYNYGLDEFPNLSNDSYAAHWHVGMLPDNADGDVNVHTSNRADVTNTTGATAKTGGNYAGGASGGNGGRGGNITSSDGADGNTTGNGGRGGNAGRGSGGIITTGAATAGAGTVNVMNDSLVRIDRCGCEDSEDGNTRVRTRNSGSLGNTTDATAKTGWNDARGAAGGNGGAGGSLTNNGDEDTDDNTTGAGGAGGTAGIGGDILTGAAYSEAGTETHVNRTQVRIRR